MLTPADYELVVGLEIHAQLSTQTKLFAADANQFGDAPNQNISPISLAHPGTLPKLNRQAVEMAVKMGLACGSRIAQYCVFARKNYFYPDLPKGYQITQDTTPICQGGHILIRPKGLPERKVRLKQIHLEEDAGKLIHSAERAHSWVDFNRAGVPLIEIVTEPDLYSPEEAHSLLYEVRKLVRYLGICDGHMEEGSLRCDANVSVKQREQSTLGTRVEIKNLNSMRFVQKAIQYEMERQIECLLQGIHIRQETRSFDAQTGQTLPMRSKEDLHDYRYFPEPDIAPLVLTADWIAACQAALPPLPQALYDRFTQVYQLSANEAHLLTEDKATALFFEQMAGFSTHYKAIAHWMMSPLKAHLNAQSLNWEAFPVSAAQLALLIDLVEQRQLSHSMATQQALPALLENPALDLQPWIQTKQEEEPSDERRLREIIGQVIAQYPDKAMAIKKGKKNLLGLFMGEIMRQTKGNADPTQANRLLLELLDNVASS